MIVKNDAATTNDLLRRLRNDFNLTLFAKGNTIVVEAPAGTITDEIRGLIRGYKLELIEQLAMDFSVVPETTPSDRCGAWVERAAIREHDGGQSQEGAERGGRVDVLAMAEADKGINAWTDECFLCGTPIVVRFKGRDQLPFLNGDGSEPPCGRPSKGTAKRRDKDAAAKRAWTFQVAEAAADRRSEQM